MIFFNKKPKHQKPLKHRISDPLTFSELDKETHERVNRIAEEFKNGLNLIKDCKLSRNFNF